MNREITRTARRCAASTLALIFLLSGGCAGLLSHIGYWSGGSLVDPEYDGLEGRRVAVICVSDSSSYGAGTEDQMLARRVTALLEENVPDIDIVPASEVADWIDKNDWDAIDYREAGRGVNAERVVAIDLSGFRLHEDQTLYKARADIAVTVFDMTQNGREAFSRSLPGITYPATGYYHVSDTPESTFRQVFLRVLARRTARFFFEYDKLSESQLDPATART